jgi:hypothetical protein
MFIQSTVLIATLGALLLPFPFGANGQKSLSPWDDFYAGSDSDGWPKIYKDINQQTLARSRRDTLCMPDGGTQQRCTSSSIQCDTHYGWLVKLNYSYKISNFFNLFLLLNSNILWVLLLFFSANKQTLHSEQKVNPISGKVINMNGLSKQKILPIHFSSSIRSHHAREA